jgi:hypothetical protein
VGKATSITSGPDDKKVSFDRRGAGQEQRETIGALLWGTSGRWDYSHELIFQWGSFQSHSIRACAATVEKGYRFESTVSKPRVGNTFSGNRDPLGRALGTFNSSINGPLLVDSGQKVARPIHDAHAAIQGQWKVNRHATLFVEYLHFFRGEFLRQSTAGHNINHLTAWLDLGF